MLSSFGSFSRDGGNTQATGLNKATELLADVRVWTCKCWRARRAGFAGYFDARPIDSGSEAELGGIIFGDNGVTGLVGFAGHCKAGRDNFQDRGGEDVVGQNSVLCSTTDRS